MYRQVWGKEAEQIGLIKDETERLQREVEHGERCYTGERIVKELIRWRVLKAEFLGKEFLSVPRLVPVVTEILKTLGIPIPPKAIQMGDTVQTSLFS